MPGETILLAACDDSICYFSGELLRQEGYGVLIAASTKTALEMAKTNVVDVLVTAENGTASSATLIDSLRRIQPSIGTVLISQARSDSFAGNRPEADSVLFEPLTKRKLLAAVRSALEADRRLREKIRLQTLHPLFEMGRSFTGQQEMEWALKSILDSALKETKAQGGAVFLIEEETGELKPRVECHLTPEGREALSSSIARLVASTGEPLVITGGKQSVPRVLLGSGKGSLISTLCVPLQVGNEAVGALQIYKTTRSKGFLQSDLEMLSIAGSQAGIAIENKRLTIKLGASYLNIISSLVSALEARAHEVQDHCRVLAACSVATGAAMNVTHDELEALRLGGMFHDIGKIGIPDNILQKPSSLSNDEYEIIKKHPDIGVEILKPVEMLRDVIPLVKHHHERFDGKGYPEGLEGQSIPLGARILAVADAYTAMTSDRPYRAPRAHAEAIHELRASAGTQLDPVVVEAFIRTWPGPGVQEAKEYALMSSMPGPLAFTA